LQAKDLQDELEDLKLALSDFQSSSKELEDEMERELANTEKRETELRTEVERLRSEVDALKVTPDCYANVLARLTRLYVCRHATR
jgi:predicted  nucleic acid-binding Zn-ribbon protein